MDNTTRYVNSDSPYFRCCIVLATKHRKSIALAPAFEDVLAAGILEYIVDTDQLGTFSGEVQRSKSPLETAKEKCKWSIYQANAIYAISSEGSFGPHPVIPFIPCDHEILYFIDTERDFHIYTSEIFTETNYNKSCISSLEELIHFANIAKFPTHGLILHPYEAVDWKKTVYKDIASEVELEAAFLEARMLSNDKKSVSIETDMRAHMNPTRMKVIHQLGKKLAERLCCLCPRCNTPGWGLTKSISGLPCEFCFYPTEICEKEILGCPKCDFQTDIEPSHGLTKAPASNCPYCNP